MVYIIAQLSFKDRDAYNRYQPSPMGVLRRFNGRLRAADEHSLLVEGSWDREKIVPLSFSDECAFRRFYDSPGYREIAKDRKLGADIILCWHMGFRRF